MKPVPTLLLASCLFAATTTGTPALTQTEKQERSQGTLSEVSFHITDASLGKARLTPVEVREEVIPEPGYCGAGGSDRVTEGKFRLQFEVGGKTVVDDLLELSFVEGQIWDPRLKKNSLPLAEQSKEQIVIIQYQGCSSISALIFGYDRKQKKMVRYSLTNHFGERSLNIPLSNGADVSPDGRVQVFERGKPKGLLQKWGYTQAWGTFLSRYLFDQPTHNFLEIPIVIAMKIWPDSTESNGIEFALYEDGYLTDMHGREKFVSKNEVTKLLDSEAAKYVLRLREKSGSWNGPIWGGGRPFYDFFFGIKFNIFQISCGGCPEELLSIKDKLLQFWQEYPSR